MKRRWFLIGAFVVVLAMLPVVGLAQAPQQQGDNPEVSSSSTSVGTSFTYQGRLTDGGSPAEGEYDFQFKLFDTATAGSQVGSTITVDEQAVTEGLFSTELDFGNVFTGQALWLEIGVRPGNDAGAFTILEPRQAVSPSPYALSLRPGAKVSGNLGLLAALSGQNTNTSAGFGLGGETQAAVAGAGVLGYASASSGEVYGVWGKSNSTAGYGVYGEAPEVGVMGEATATSGYTVGVLGKSKAQLGAGVKGVNTSTGGIAMGVYGSTASSLGYAGYFSNDANGVDIMAGGSGIIKSKADSVLYLSPHEMVVRDSTGVTVTPLDNGGVDIAYQTSGMKYLSIPVSTFGTLFGARVYIKSLEVCYDTNPDLGYIATTTVSRNNGGDIVKCCG